MEVNGQLQALAVLPSETLPSIIQLKYWVGPRTRLDFWRTQPFELDGFVVMLCVTTFSIFSNHPLPHYSKNKKATA